VSGGGCMLGIIFAFLLAIGMVYVASILVTMNLITMLFIVCICLMISGGFYFIIPLGLLIIAYKLFIFLV
jgi:hypothetical protein